MDIKQFDYPLPPSLIAQVPSKRRDRSRLLVLDNKTGTIEHKHFADILALLKKGDVLVINDSKVIPARFFGTRHTGGKVEFLAVRMLENNHWLCMTKSRGKLNVQEEILLEGGNSLTLIAKHPDGFWEVRFNLTDVMKFLKKYGLVPLPPYIKRTPHDAFEQLDRKRYQTIFSRANGSVAAPTAGLHFTKSLLKKIENKGVSISRLTLHVGPGTFKPVQTDTVETHTMDAEYFEYQQGEMNKVARAIKTGSRVIAVGSTSTRVLEHLGEQINEDKDHRGWTDLFIYPPYEFKIVDCMITNFHLPQSTLFILVCAFAGIDNTFKAYREAIEKAYRFYSYGDAMFIC